jgi:hypothetical protein
LQFESYQRIEIDPDDVGYGAAALISDCSAKPVTIGGIYTCPVDYSGIVPKPRLATLKLTKSDHRTAISHGERVFWDNFHQTGRNKVGLPGFNKPGCAECVHAHWSWDTIVNDFTSGWTDGKPELLDGSKQNAEIIWAKYDPTQELTPPYELLGTMIGKTDRVVMYWDAETKVEDSPPSGVSIGGSLYSYGDSYWPQLDNVRHGGNGSMFFVPARLLMPPTISPGSPGATNWQVLQSPVSQEATALDARLPAGYVVPATITYSPPAHSAPIKGGPFYLRVNGNCVSNTLLNADPLWYATALGPPWFKVYFDNYQPGGGGVGGTFTPGQIVDKWSPGTKATVNLVFSTPPTAPLTFELVAAPYGTAGYEPTVDTNPTESLGPLQCATGP